jgi:aryl-alcohol dehydrogenase-like predicted oxidoreductase
MKALHDLVESGKVRYIGASSMRTWQFALLNDTAEKNGWTKFVSMQNRVSLLYREEVRHSNCYLLRRFSKLLTFRRNVK